MTEQQKKELNAKLKNEIMEGREQVSYNYICSKNKIINIEQAKPIKTKFGNSHVCVANGDDEHFFFANQLLNQILTDLLEIDKDFFNNGEILTIKVTKVDGSNGTYYFPEVI